MKRGEESTEFYAYERLKSFLVPEQRKENWTRKIDRAPVEENFQWKMRGDEDEEEKICIFLLGSLLSLHRKATPRRLCVRERHFSPSDGELFDAQPQIDNGNVFSWFSLCEKGKRNSRSEQQKGEENGIKQLREEKLLSTVFWVIHGVENWEIGKISENCHGWRFKVLAHQHSLARHFLSPRWEQMEAQSLSLASSEVVFPISQGFLPPLRALPLKIAATRRKREIKEHKSRFHYRDALAPTLSSFPRWLSERALAVHFSAVELLMKFPVRLVPNINFQLRLKLKLKAFRRQ